MALQVPEQQTPSQPEGPKFAFKRLDEMKTERSPISLLYYGGSGTGKTWFLGTAGSRSLIIDTGYGPIETLKSKLFREKNPGCNPIIISIREPYKIDPTTQVQIPAAEAFDMICDAIDYALESYYDEIDTVSIDIATGVRRFAMNKGLVLSGELNKSKTHTNVVKKHGFVVPAVQDFGMEMNIVEWFISKQIEICKEAGKNFILTAHVRETFKKPKGEGGKTLIGEPAVLDKIRPGFTGQTFPDDVPGLFDEVWYAERTGSGNAAVWRCKCHGDEVLTAKTTYGAGVLTNAEVNPNFLKMLERIWTGAAN